MFQERCDIILPTCGQGGLVRDCIESLIKSTKYPYRLIVIDNGACEETAEYLDSIAKSGRLRMELIRPPENLGWIRSINAGLKISRDSKYICFQNDDTVFTEGWLEELVNIFEKDPQIGIANPEWEKPQNVSIEEYALRLRKYKYRTVDTDWCRGHCFFLRREVVEKIGGLDKAYIPGYYDDRDYSLKAIEAGYRCVRAKGVFVYHIRNSTIAGILNPEKIKVLQDDHGRIFYSRWGYPLKLIFVLGDVARASGILRMMCMDQNKVIIMARKGEVIPYEHTNLKTLRFDKPFFKIAALSYLISNRSRKPQKKTDFIFTDDKAFYSFLRPFDSLIPADIIFRDRPDTLSGEALKLVKEKKEKIKVQSCELCQAVGEV